MKRFFIIIFIFLINAITILAEEAITLPSEVGVVKKVEYIETLTQDMPTTKQQAEIKILKGAHKGKYILVDNILTGNPHYDINLKENTKVILHVEKDGNGLIYSIENIYRANVLYLLALIFCGLLIYIGKRKGLYSLISILLTIILIFYLLSPLILVGISPVLATILICLLSTAITIYLVGGFNKKSTSATLGCTLSLILAGILSLLTTKFASLTGFANENSLYLYSAHPELNIIGIAVSTMILAALGAVMDVSMSIASTINEIHTVDRTKSIKELFICGMNVGRDIIGTMANTLILVYLGGALPLVLLSSNIDFYKFINLNQVVTEISSALIGSSAIVICVPITAIIAANLIKHNDNKVDFTNLEA